MNILPKDKTKRIHFILVIVVTIGVMAGIGFGPIRLQYESLHKLMLSNMGQQDDLQQIKNTLKQSDATVAELADATVKLQQAESDLAFGDVYAWTVDTVRKFKTSYHVEIPSFGQPTAQSEVDLIPAFPYKQIKVNVSGTAYYHDLGKFVSDFENTFPHMRVVNVVIEPSTLPGTSDTEKLAFRMDIVTLVKSGS